jgi:hypothetical protein
MLVINPPVYQILRGTAEAKGIDIQQLLRAVIIPEWLRAHKANKASRVSLAMELMDQEALA